MSGLDEIKLDVYSSFPDRFTGAKNFFLATASDSLLQPVCLTSDARQVRNKVDSTVECNKFYHMVEYNKFYHNYAEACRGLQNFGAYY